MITRDYINMKLKNNRYRNSMIHKYKSLFIFVFMIGTLLIPNRAYANMQRDITSLTAVPSSIFDSTSKTITPSITVQWGAPVKDTDATVVPESGVSLLPGEAEKNHQIQGYQILLRCLSNNTDWQQVGTAKAGDTSYTIDSRYVKNGLIYQVDVKPFHYHSYQNGDETLTRLASLVDEKNHDQLIKAVILDPEVKTETDGTKIIVTFDDGGEWVDYTIAYRIYTNDVFKDYNPQTAAIIKRSDMTTSIDNGKTKLTYTIIDPTIEAGQFYGILVKAKSKDVEPRVIIPSEKQVWQCATKAPFNIQEESNDYIKLTWKGLDLSNVEAIEIYSQVDGSPSETKYSTIYPKNKGNNDVDYYMIRKPEKPTFYRIKVVYEYGKNGAEDIASFSESILYDPTLNNETPGKPVFYDIDAINKRFNENGELTLNIRWKPYAYGEASYDILITDDVSILSALDINNKDFVPKYEPDQDPIRGYYFYDTTEYITKIKEGNIDRGYAVQKLKENVVYYVRIIGKVEANQKVLKSEPAVRAFYVDSDKVMFLPPSLPKPPLVKKQVTNNSATLEWNTTWWEVCAMNQTNDPNGINYNLNTDWTSMIYYIERNNNLFIYLTEADAKRGKQSGDEIKSFNISDDSSFRNFKDTLLTNKYGIPTTDNTFTVNGINYFARRVSFTRDAIGGASDIEYEGFFLDDKTASNNMRPGETYDAYIERYLSDYPDSWKDIAISKGPMNQTTFNLPKENTTYWLIVRGYRYDESGNKVVAEKPSIIIVTTTLKQSDIEPVPTVPTLLLVSTKDISAKFKWEFQTELAYEVRISETEDVETATPIDITNEMINDLHAEKDGQFYIYEQLDLFPLTGYYIWIKAKQVKGTLESAWSNPLMFVTSDLLPDPRFAPGGIGVAPQTDAITEDHITLEWSRVAEDIELDNYKGTKIIKNISYVFEIADNVKFLDSKIVECGALDNQGNTSDFLIYSKTMARALNLKSNTRYYVRIKTKIQVKEAQGSRSLEKESPWSIIKIFKTSSVNEYDSEYGDIDVPVPEKLLTVYNGNTVRINVNNDDSLITELIKQGLFDYTFDFSNEKSTYNKREVYIPLSVLLAMQNRDVNIILKSNDTTVNVNSKAFKNLDYENLTRQGGVTGLVLTLNDDNSIYPINVMSRELGAYYSTRYGDYKTTYLEDYMEVLFDTTKSVYFSKNKARGVTYDSKTRSWIDAKDSYTLGYNLILKTGHMGKVGISY